MRPCLVCARRLTTAEKVCLCREVPAEPFPRLAWHEDCPQHGKKVNPYWPELEHSDGSQDG